MIILRAKHLPRDDDLLHVGRALVDAQRPDLAIEALDDVAAAHAVAAVQLHGLVDHLLRAVGGEQLGHRRLAGDAGGAHVLGPGGAVDEQRGGVDVERHVGDVALHHLQLGQRRAEQLALARARLIALVERAAGKAERGGADRRAEHVEHRHGDA